MRTSATFAAVAVLLIAGCGGGGKSDPPKAGGSSTTGGKAGSASATKLGPPTLRFTQAGHLPVPMQLPAAAPLASNGALVMGGLDSADSSSSAIVRVSGNTATRAGTLPAALHDAAAATVGSRTLFIGGGNAGATSSAIDLVSPGGVTSHIGSLPKGASDVAAAAVGGQIYVAGGYDGANPLDTIVRVSPDGHSQVVGHLPQPVRYAAVTAAGNHVIVAGGTVGTSASTGVYSFDPGTGRVSRLASLPSPTTHAAAGYLGGQVFVIGGRAGTLNSQRSTVVAIDPATGHVRKAGHLPAQLSDLSAVSLPNQILVFGGRDPSGHVSDVFWRATVVRRAAHAAKAAAAPDPPPAHASAAPVNTTNIYAADTPGNLSPVARQARALVYVPNSRSNTVDVISQATGNIVGHFDTGTLPQHVTPSWDLKTLYVTNDVGNSLTPIDPRTGKPGQQIPVTDPYNMYFTTDGRYAIVVEEAHRVLAFRDPHSMALRHALDVSMCPGVDHMDFTADGRYALASCEFGGRMIVVDLTHQRVTKTIALSAFGMPQDVKLSPDGRTFYVADMQSGGVWMVDAKTMRKIGFIKTGAGAHGLYPSRDAKTLYVSNRGEGSISLIDFRTRRVRGKWHIPGGGSPDMGGVSADGKVLWLSGRYNDVVYAISTTTGSLLHRIPVGAGPHGLCVWPQPGRYSIGHTGILR